MLDRETLAVVVSTVSLVTVLVMYTVWRINRQVRGLRWWMAASLSAALSFVLVPLVQGAGGSYSQALILNNTGSLLTLAFLLQGCLRFRGLAPARHWRWALWGVAPLALLSSVLNQGHAARRYLIHDAASVVLLLLAATAMVWRTRAEERLVQRVAAFFLLLMAAALALRWGLVWQAPADASIQQHGLQGPLYLVIVVFTMGWTYSVSLACYQQAQSRVLALAREDALTGLPNRRYFDETLDREVARAERDHEFFGLAMVDLNGFKQVNDRLGHDAGDAVLVELARRLREFARGGDFVARLGGDEFIVLVHALPTAEAAEQVLARLRQALDGPLRLGGQRVEIEASLGLARWPVDGAQPGALMKVADQRMYLDKARLKSAAARQRVA